jgi:cell division protein FtsA
MNPRLENLITVLDAGSSKSCVLVAELTRDELAGRHQHGVADEGDYAGGCAVGD